MLRTLLALLLVASSVLAAAPARAAGTWSDGACTDALGVTVAIDYGGLGGGTVVRCAENFAAAVSASGRAGTGLDALVLAGFTWAPPQREPGAVCRLNGRPAASETLAQPSNPAYREQCIQMPPETAFWSYWHAPAGGSWSFSNFGAGNRPAQPGGFEGWRFSLGSGQATAPSVRPVRGEPRPTTASPASQTTTAAAPTTAPTSAPTTRATTGPATTATTATTTAAAGAGRTTTAPATRSVSAVTTASATSASASSAATSPTAPASTGSASPTVTESAPTTTPEPTPAPSESASQRPVPADTAAAPPGPAAPTEGTRGGTTTIGGIVAVGAVALLGGGVWFLRRRRG